jgi:hypothetical protein
VNRKFLLSAAKKMQSACVKEIFSANRLKKAVNFGKGQINVLVACLKRDHQVIHEVHR